MKGSDDLLGGGPGDWVLGLCVLGLLVVLAPIWLAALGFGAIMALSAGLGGGPPNGGSPVNSTSPVAVVGGPTVQAPPIRPVMASSDGLVAGWANRDTLNQYTRQNYRTDQNWQIWRNADCSAAAFDWLLGAYGQPLGSIDDANRIDRAGKQHLGKTGTARRAGTCSRPRVGGPWPASPCTRPASTGLHRRTQGLAGASGRC